MRSNWILYMDLLSAAMRLWLDGKIVRFSFFFILIMHDIVVHRRDIKMGEGTTFKLSLKN